jgi:hypothetical protein
MWAWLLHFTGVRPLQPSYWYNFWSGFGANFGELAIVGGLLTIVRQHNCHVHRCWRLGRHEVEGTPHKVCRRHHPDGHLTHAGLLEAHARAAKPQARAGSRSQPGSMGLPAESGPVPPAAARASKTKVKP